MRIVKIMVLLLFLTGCIHVHCNNPHSERRINYQNVSVKNNSSSMTKAEQDAMFYVLAWFFGFCYGTIVIHDLLYDKAFFMFDICWCLFWGTIAALGASSNNPPLAAIPFGVSFGTMFTLTLRMIFN